LKVIAASSSKPPGLVMSKLKVTDSPVRSDPAGMALLIWRLTDAEDVMPMFSGSLVSSVS
jgi:hypothetical protein